jgi:sulfite reductase (ferredoxin)
MASIGFHGAGMKAGANQVPASFILLGGHTIGDGEARLADKIVKIPSKRCPEALTRVLNHFIAERAEGEKFGDYYQRFGAEFYGQLFADLADTTVVTDNELIDWGRDGIYEARDKDGKKVTIDLIVTLFEEGREKIENAEVAIAESRWADSISHSYWVLVNTAKALLLTVGAKTNSRAQITEAFEEKFGDNPALGKGFGELVYQIKHNEPSEEFARKYLAQTKALITSASAFYQEQKASN